MNKENNEISFIAIVHSSLITVAIGHHTPTSYDFLDFFYNMVVYESFNVPWLFHWILANSNQHRYSVICPSSLKQMGSNHLYPPFHFMCLNLTKHKVQKIRETFIFCGLKLNMYPNSSYIIMTLELWYTTNGTSIPMIPPYILHISFLHNWLPFSQTIK